MARTKYGKLMGRAAATELREFRQEIEDAYWREVDNVRDAMIRMEALNPYGWETWYDATIPEDATRVQITEMVNQYCDELEQEAVKALEILFALTPPEPATAAEAHAAMLMECPWMDDILDLGESPTETRSQVLGF